jgi:hypothetical protein
MSTANQPVTMRIGIPNGRYPIEDEVNDGEADALVITRAWAGRYLRPALFIRRFSRSRFSS